MNPFIQALLFGDMFYLTAFGLLTPIFAVFLRDRVPNITLISVGLAEAFFLLTVALLRPFARLNAENDRKGWRTQVHLWFGSALIVLTPLMYLMATDMQDIYVIQILYGIGLVFCEPAWLRLTEILRKKHVEFKNAQYQSLGGLLAAAMALIGGFIAQYSGIPALLLFLGVMLACAAVLMITLYWRNGLKPIRAKTV